MKQFPQQYDERLWFTHVQCQGRHYVLGAASTFPGRMLGWCPAKQCSFFFSKGEVEDQSEFTSIWIQGFLAGNVPRRPDAVEDAKWDAQVTEFLQTGYWVEDRDRPQTLTEDIELARRRGIAFQVMERAGRHEPWIAVSDAIGDLEAALSVAMTRLAWRVGVFTSDGIIYWTSDSPEIRNSTVLHDTGTPGHGTA
jgi:hypothetical protein